MRRTERNLTSFSQGVCQQVFWLVQSTQPNMKHKHIPRHIHILCVYYTSLLYTLLLVQRNRWFANSDIPFQSSVTNDLLHGQFAMQIYALNQVDVTSELSHSWWFVHAQSNNKKNLCIALHVTLDLSTQAYGRVDKNRTQGRILHAELYINYYLWYMYML